MHEADSEYSICESVIEFSIDLVSVGTRLTGYQSDPAKSLPADLVSVEAMTGFPASRDFHRREVGGDRPALTRLVAGSRRAGIAPPPQGRWKLRHGFRLGHASRLPQIDCHRTSVLLLCFLACLLIGCGETSDSLTTDSPPPVKSADPSAEPVLLTVSELRQQLRANENAEFKRVGNTFVEAVLFQSGAKTIEPLKGLPLRVLDLGACKAISDISALEGMPLKRLILEDTSITDISPLAGMKLELLYLQNTAVKDLSVLKGMPIEQLNLMNVPISDLSVVTGMPMTTLWIPGTQVTDLSPLKDVPLESLDVEELPLTDFSVITEMTSLKRLNISGTPLQDVSILGELKLDRITLTPDTITAGMDVLRNMSSLTQVWVSTGLGAETQQFDAADFWKRYDEGAWTKTEEPSSENEGAEEKASDEKSE